MADILFKTDDYVFSYRVGGLLIHNGKVLMQKAVDDDGYAFIGGCVRRSAKSPRPGKLSSGSAEIEQWDRPD